MTDVLAARIRAAIAEEVAAELRHDLRNHLAAIRNAAYYLRRRTEATPLWTEDPRIATFFDLIASESQRADERIGERGGALPRAHEAARVGAAITRALHGVTVPRDVVVHHEAPPGLPFAGSEDDLALAVRMLLENAVEAVDGAGEITVAAARTERAIEIEVRDSGPGIDDPERALAGRATTKPGRLGLGLPIATRAMRRLGGELEILPSLRGARVRLRLPAVDP